MLNEAKLSRMSFNTKEYTTSKPLKLVHKDLYGPTRTKRLQGEKYFMLLIDNYARKIWVSFLKNKYEEF
jgi:hypothetical protein